MKKNTNKTSSKLSSKSVEKRYLQEIEKEVRFRLKKQEETYLVQQRLIETQKVSEESFIECASFMQPSHYEDVIVERSLAGLCGYPTCGNSVSVDKVSMCWRSSNVIFFCLLEFRFKKQVHLCT